MSVSQTVRTTLRTDANPTGLVPDILQLGATLSGSGVPDSSTSGIQGNSYIDTATGIEYVKQSDGTWSPIYDPSTLPAPDPFPVGTLDANFVNTDELKTDKIQGRNAENVVIDGQTTGLVQVVTNNTRALQIGAVGSEDNSYIQNNGYAVFSSGTKQYDLLLDNAGGQAIKHEVAPNYKSYVSGVPSEWIIENENAPITLSSNNLINIKETASGNKLILDPLNGYVQSESGAGITITAIDPTQPARIEGGSVSGNVQLVPGTSGFVDVQGATSKISTQVANTFTIEHRLSGQDVELKAIGAGNCRLSPGVSGEVILSGNANCQNNDLINVGAVNGGDVLGRFGSLSVDSGGALQYAHNQCAHTFCWNAVGGATTNEYGSIGGFTVAPADVTGIYIPYTSKMSMATISLSYSANWTFGAGTASVTIGTVPTGLPMTNSNFVAIPGALFNIPTGVDFFQYGLSSATNITIPSGRLCARLNVAGSTPTSTNAEMVLTVFTF